MADGFSDAQLRQISQKFDELQKGMRNRFARRGLRRGAAVVRNAVRRRAASLDDPETGESIAKNVTVQSSRRLSKPGQIGFRVGIRGGAKKYANTRENVRAGRAGKTYQTGGDKGNPGGDTWYWRFLEFGRGPVVAGKKTKTLANSATGKFFGKSVRSAAAKPFMRPAMAESAEPAIDAVAASINADIDKFAREAK